MSVILSFGYICVRRRKGTGERRKDHQGSERPENNTTRQGEGGVVRADRACLNVYVCVSFNQPTHPPTHLVDHADVLRQLGRHGPVLPINVDDDEVARLLVRLFVYGWVTSHAWIDMSAENMITRRPRIESERP